jgi:hypothetical protein
MFKRVKEIGSAVARDPKFWFKIYLVCLLLMVARGTLEGAKAGAELMRGASNLAWPTIVAAAAWFFRNDLRLLILRTRKAGLSGVEFAEAITAQAVLKPISESIRKVAPLLTNEVMIDRAAKIRADLDQIEPDSIELREARLTKDLASLQLTNKFMRVYMVIFESQLEAMNAMAAGNDGADLETFYRLHTERYKEATLERVDAAPVASFQAWANFLVTQGLILIEGRSGNLTDEGRLFLDYLLAERFPRFNIF